jgi:hypothetical protein
MIFLNGSRIIIMFDLSDSLRPDLHDVEFKKALGKLKDEMHSLLISEFIA